jgi:penicillin-binding protein 1C
MRYLHAREPSRAPVPPAGVSAVAVRFGPGNTGSAPLEAPRSEWFITGTSQPLFAVAGFGDAGPAVNAAPSSAQAFRTVATTDNGAAPRITAPADGTILALDPDIPPNRQRLTLEAQGAGLRWRMDGREIARGNRVLWMPWPGRHQVQIADARGNTLHEIRIEVRGAGVRPAAR